MEDWKQAKILLIDDSSELPGYAVFCSACHTNVVGHCHTLEAAAVHARFKPLCPACAEKVMK
jgi:hypothetical protein